MKRSECDSFLQGYLDAALFTTDPNPPQGVDYAESDRADKMYQKIPNWFIENARKDCAKFAVENHRLLGYAGDAWQNGADFWFTRNRHGVGFWDRGYSDDVGDPLSDAAHSFGESYLDETDLGFKPNEN